MKIRTTAFERMLERYGQTATVHFDGGEPLGVVTRAFVQPLLNRKESWFQKQYTRLGTSEDAAFLYLGSADVPLDQLGQGYIESMGKRFDVRAAEAVFLGTEVSHWWALLAPREEDDVCP